METAPNAETRAARLCSRNLFAAVSIYAVWAVFRIYHTRDNFLYVYDDMKLTPPLITTIVTHACYPLTIPLVMLAGFLAQRRIRDPYTALALNGILLVFVLILLDAYLCGIWDPFISIMESLQSGKPH
jgi:hypothetical protein